MIDVSEMLTAAIIRVIIILIMEAVSTSETSVNFYQTTWRNIQGDSCILNLNDSYVSSEEGAHGRSILLNHTSRPAIF
jgi:hypothetical protein